jgi:BNR repeat-like domain
MSRRFTRAHVVASAIVVTVVCAAAVAVASGHSQAATPTAKPSRDGLAKALLAHNYARFGTPALTRGLEFTAGDKQSPARELTGPNGGVAAAAVARGGAAALPRAGLANVRVNNPAADHFQVDQTTQSETSVAVAGSKVAVGFNDTQQGLLFLTDGLDSSGYGYSADGGRTFTDGGALPNPLNFVNLGDPWLTSDRAGRMYYATLTYGGNVGNLEVGVARSTDGGKTWAAPTLASPNNDDLFYQGDKDAIVAGRAPQLASRDNLYVTWDDFVFDFAADRFTTGLPVATSTDHGTSWSLHYADKIVNDPNSCSFRQYIGAQPLVDPTNGTLYVAAEKISVDDPTCTLTAPPTLSQVIFKSTDGGNTFGPGVKVASVVPATPIGALELGPGLFIRTVEFPVMALRKGTLWMAWNDGRTGRSHITLASSTNGGATWSLSSATRGSGDEVQPALSVDSKGLHLAYYQRNANNTLDTVVADSTDGGIHFTATAITSRSFPGVRTIPQFDPVVAYGYMGDYIANVSDGAHQYFAWGDNRDRITNFTHPRGRNDPDVFFARR